ncbi:MULTISPECIES: hypothetical protein [Halomonas]|uniref:hypothetical protein n=1 Tax=Halomonas TaxID=2745 RepID=UPI003CF33090
MKRSVLAVSVAMLGALVSSPLVADVSIPVVPASVMSDAPPPIIANADTSGQTPRATSADTRQVEARSHLYVKPGVNELVPVAVGHLNRIVTPFSNPQVTTSSAATTEIRNNVVYVGTDQEQPVTMFVTQKDSEAEAISLTLVPRRIPPREVFVELDGGRGAQFGLSVNEPAERWEESQPYVDTLRNLLRSVALGELPQGYTFHETRGRGDLPSCQQAGLSFDFGNGQVMMGQNLRVSIGTAQNTSSQPLEFREASCGNWDVAAVAAWPRNVLAPDEKTEIYVVNRRGQSPSAPANSQRRPSLLGGPR